MTTIMDSNFPNQLARRTFLGQASLGLGSMALAGLLQPQRVRRLRRRHSC